MLQMPQGFQYMRLGTFLINNNMGYLKEIIVDSIDFNNNQVTYTQQGNTFTKSVETGEAYLLPIDNGKHLRYVSDDNNILSEQTADIVVPPEVDPIFTASPAATITNSNINYWNNKLDVETDPTVPNYVKAITQNDINFWNSSLHNESDPTVPSWVKNIQQSDIVNWDNKANKTITISTNSPLQGGGDLSANRVLSILQATSSQSGYLSYTDWNIFNNKLTIPSLTNNYVGRWSTTSGNFINGAIQDDGIKIGIGGNVDSSSLPTRINLQPLNGKYFRFPTIASVNVVRYPTAQIGDIWTDSGYFCYHSGIKGEGSNQERRIVSVFVEGLSNIFTGIDFNSVKYGITDMEYNYGYALSDTSKPNNTFYAVNGDSRMFSGGLLTVQGAQIVFDIKGNAFFRGHSGVLEGETDWKKALTDNQNKTTTLGSETNYTNIKWAVDSTTQAALIAPRMTQAQRLAITLGTTQTGAVVYQTDGSFGYYLWNGTSWQSLGSNIATADLTNTQARIFTQNASFTWDTLGNPYYWKGLLDKTNDLVNYNRVLGFNPTTKEVAVTSAVQVAVPDTVTVNGLTPQTITVNHIYPNPVPNMTTYPQEVLNLAGNMKTLNYTSIIGTDWNIFNNPNGISSIIGGNLNLKCNTTESNPPTSAILNKEFPTNKEWVIKLYFTWKASFNYASRISIGIVQSDNISVMIPSNQFSTELLNNGSQTLLQIAGTENALGTVGSSHNQGASLTIIHSNNAIYIIGSTSNGNYARKLFANTDVNGQKFRLNTIIIQSNQSYTTEALINGEYWIAP